MPIDKIIQTAQSQKLTLIKSEDKFTMKLIKAFADTQKYLSAQLNLTLKQINDGAKAGKPPTPSQIYASARFKVLLAQTNAELAKYGITMASTVKDRQTGVMIPTAITDVNHLTQVTIQNSIPETPEATEAQRLTLAANGWNYLNPEKTKKLVQLLEPGTETYKNLSAIAPNATEALRQSIITRVGTGEQPEQVAKSFKDDLAGELGQYLTIARTANMDAYRQTIQQTGQDNKGIVYGWKWQASLSFSACGACLSMNGQEFETDEDMDTHYNCRCSQLWLIRGFKPIDLQSGESWLRSQPEEIQKLTLTPGKYDAWKSGKITLNDLTQHSDGARPNYHESSLKDALAKAGN